MTATPPAAMSMQGVDVFYGAKHAVRDVTLDLPARTVTAFIGPSGCGKSTVLRCLNRMNDTIPSCRVTGRIRLGDTPIDAGLPLVELRRRVGMVFQKPNPFPLSIYDNVAYGLRLHGRRSRAELDAAVERALRRAALWDEVCDRLDAGGLSLSGGQQQRLCIARALAVEPEVLLLDEPTSALDPIATQAIEALMTELAEQVTLVVVTHNMQQARRVASHTAVFYLGELDEFGATTQVFDDPQAARTRAYVKGDFG